MNLQQQFYKQLNQSPSWDYKQDRWQAYRLQMTDAIVQGFGHDESVLILAAGGLNDVDISRLYTHAKSVTLLDVDQEAVVSGIKGYGLSLNDFSIIINDVTGLSEQGFFSKLQTLFLNQGKASEIVAFISEKMHASCEAFTNQFSTVIVLPIYTQMLLPIFQSMIGDANVIKYYTERELSDITQIYLQQSAIMLEKFNQMVISAVAPSGRLVVLADIIELTDDMMRHSGLLTENPPITDSKRLEAYVNTYWNQYGYGYSGYGIKHLSELLPLKKSFYTIWPYSDNRNMIVAYALYTKQ